ncbi:MAG: ABC transporter ATP-binding protein [Endomicrobiales bacterium]
MLELRHVSCGYGVKSVLHDVSFGVGEGDFVGIIGPNGAGKTTLFRLMTGLMKPWQGDVLFRGQNIGKIARRELACQMATMPQISEAAIPFPVGEFVLMGRYPHRRKFDPPSLHDREAVESALELTGVRDLRARMLHELSGGERQRVILAQALAQEPKVLLLDEPTAHLDIGHQIEILDLIRKLNRSRKITVITILHDLNLAGEYCGNLILLKEGAIHSRGTSRDVLTYQNIEQVFNTIVVVRENPFSSKPYILLVSEENAHSAKPVGEPLQKKG